ncbi:hypothetical protein PP175_14835 [Aneurinibacillus sp. Ricciae_BoGa-3]|uniref:hypothetical protein n=1 Tax=Aneurinibacillus sp. Ricciae_BoGa-3 TaxID=3022697 RepID=UPI002340BD66|nr:hypothetical protein [Aneurinibacillus sp. Ricciae_BoGa-3]WCK52705.1 hypothetical protein PP175_14835 [Aneurinibacillus sp. Ricciae_BoGa-3]
MNKISRFCSFIVIGGMVAAALAGCSSNTSTAANTTASAAAGTSGNASKVHNGHKNGTLQKLEDAGASQADAKALIKLIREKHVQTKWVIDRLKNKQSVSSIETAINGGKAPAAVKKQTKDSTAQGNSSTAATKE